MLFNSNIKIEASVKCHKCESSQAFETTYDNSMAIIDFVDGCVQDGWKAANGESTCPKCVDNLVNKVANSVFNIK